MDPPRIGTSSGSVVYSKYGSGLQYLKAVMDRKKRKEMSHFEEL
jgi:hypothetical protein